VVCAGGEVSVWTINGRLLHSNRTQPAASPITAVTLTQSCEWSSAHKVYITGHQDGTIMVRPHLIFFLQLRVCVCVCGGTCAVLCVR
jgi:hypothetical protein